MRRRSLPKRIISFALCFVFIMQGGFVMPAFAESSFYYNFLYQEEANISQNDENVKDVTKPIHPVIIPDGDIDPEFGVNTHRSLQSDTQFNVGEPIPASEWENNISQPYRVIGYTFDGWYVAKWDRYGLGQLIADTNLPIEKDTPIQESWLEGSQLYVMGVWSEYTSPIITSGSLSILKRDTDDFDLYDEIRWTTDGTTRIYDFDSEVETYYANVYGNMNSIKLSFEQYEPDAVTTVSYNGTRLDDDTELDKTAITAGDGNGQAYRYSLDGTELISVGSDYITGYNIGTKDYLTLLFSDDSELDAQDGYNLIEVKVQLPKVTDGEGGQKVLDYENGESRTYKFYIKRLSTELYVENGNTPYGIDEDKSDAFRQEFHETLEYGNAYYTEKAWWRNPDTDRERDEVLKGTEYTNDTQYINYDEDETALVVSSGDSFTDPGISLIEKGITYKPGAVKQNGNTVKITRTIKYNPAESLKYSAWKAGASFGATVTDTATLDGTAGENIIKILDHKEWDSVNQRYKLRGDDFKGYVPPGVYDIEYSYKENPADENEQPVIATRKLIVIPKTTNNHRDLNMDGYINALDSLVYDTDIAKYDDSSYSSLSEFVYRYRALDVSPNGRTNGVIDASDKEYYLSNDYILSLYASRSVEENTVSIAYTPPLTADTANKAQLYMEYLGKYSRSATTAEVTAATDAVKAITSADQLPEVAELAHNDVFFVGYRLDNVANLHPEGDGKVKVLTLSINYDSRYVSPLASNLEAMKANIETYNEGLKDKFTLRGKYNETYAVDNSTAKQTWQATGQIRTMRMELYFDEDYELQNGYLFKLPFRVDHKPPEDGRNVIMTQLGATTLNFAIGDTGYMWDTGDALNSVTRNLTGTNGCLEYMGDYKPKFDNNTDDAIALPDAKYGEEYSYNTTVRRSETENMPAGLAYTYSNGIVSGIPCEAGTHYFYIGGQRYSIYVKPAVIHVRLKEGVSLEKVYGDENPNYDLTVVTEKWTADNSKNYDDYCFEYVLSDIKFPEARTLNGGTAYEYTKPAETIDAIVKEAPTFTNTATKTTPVTDSPFDITFNEGSGASNGGAGDIGNYTFEADDVTMEITQRPIKVTDASVASISINSSFGPGRVVVSDAVNDTTKEKWFTAEGVDGAEGILSGDTVTIRYSVVYDYTKEQARDKLAGNEYVDNIDVSIDGISITDLNSNYKLESTEVASPTHKGRIDNTKIVDFDLISYAGMQDLTYGELLDFDKGRIRLQYDDENYSWSSDMTLQEAQAAGLKFYYVSTDETSWDEREINAANDHLPATVDSTGTRFKRITVWAEIPDTSIAKNPRHAKASLFELHVVQRDITITANDKERVYGDGLNGIFTDTSFTETMYNPTGTESDGGKGQAFTYSITNYEDIASWDNIETITSIFTAEYDCDEASDAGMDIDKNSDHNTANIGLTLTTRAENTNYHLIPVDGTLTIKQRPIKITGITGGIPRLTSDEYIAVDEGQSTGTLKTTKCELDAAAYAGVDTPTMTVTTEGVSGNGLYTGDKIKLTYKAQYPVVDDSIAYAALDPSKDVTYNKTITAIDIELPDGDEDFPKNHNYALDNSALPAGTGVVHARYITSIEVTKKLKSSYHYGNKYNLEAAEGSPSSSSEDGYEKNNIHIVYDSGETEDITFLDAYNASRKDFAVTGNPTHDYQVDVTSDTGKVTVLTYNGKTDTENPLEFKDTEDNKTYKADPVTIGKHPLHIESVDVYAIYGDSSPYWDGTKYLFTYKIREADIQTQNGDTASNILTTEPTLTCFEDDGKTPVSEKTPVAVYPIHISGAESENYEPVYIEGDLAIRKKALVIDTLDPSVIENLTAAQAHEGGTALRKSIDVTAKAENGVLTTDTPLTFSGNNKLLFNDKIRFTATATYTDPTYTGANASVAITNGKIVDVDAEGNASITSRNYDLQAVNTPQNIGTIDDRKISQIRVNYNPAALGGSGYTSREYKYGDAFDWDSFRMTVSYDNETSETIGVDQLSEYHIRVQYIKDGEYVNADFDKMKFLTFEDDNYNGKTLYFSSDPDYSTNNVAKRDFAASNCAIKVVKRPMHVSADDKSHDYGNTPETFTVSYRTSDFADGENSTNAFTGNNTLSKEHKFKCLDSEGNEIAIDENNRVSDRTDAGEYTIRVSGGECQNYDFIYADDGETDATGYFSDATLTVNRRQLNVSDVTTVHSLTSTEVYQAVNVKHENTVSKTNLDAVASRLADGSYTDSTNLVIEGLLAGDTITAKYDIQFDNLTPSDNAPVTITSFELADVAGVANINKNYVLNERPRGKGEVYRRLIKSLSFDVYPDLEYSYGQWFDASKGFIIIEYNDGSPNDRINFNNYANRSLTIEFVKQDEGGEWQSVGNVRQNTLLTVAAHDGAHIRVSAPSDNCDTTYAPIISDDDHKVTVTPKTMRITVAPKTMKYNDALPSPIFEWEYNTADLVNGDTLESARFKIDGKTADPTGYDIKDAEGNVLDLTDPDYKLNAGTYYIVAKGAENVNYVPDFENGKGTLTVEKLPIKITGISGTVPALTSEDIFLNGSTNPPVYKHNQKADMSRLSFDEGFAPVGDDEIGITYSIRYDTTMKTDDTQVGVVNVGLDEDFEDSVNYSIEECIDTLEHGSVDEEQISEIIITQDPTRRAGSDSPLQYTYGDTLNLSRGSATIVYDSSRREPDVLLSEIAEKTNGKVTLYLVDKNGNETLIGSDPIVLTRSQHDGNIIRIKAESSHDVDNTDSKELSVGKAAVTVRADDVSRPYGDDNNVLSYKFVSGFRNGDTENTLRQTTTGIILECTADRKSAPGEYPITVSGGENANYTFVYESGTLTVTKRPLDIIEITKGVPVLTSKQIYEEPQLIHRLDGVALSSAGQLILGNLFLGDTVRITYTVTYTRVEPGNNVEVGLSDIVIDPSYGDGANYVLRNKPVSFPGGTILDKELSSIEIIRQPKLDYVYGETLDLSETGVKLVYDDSSSISGVSFEELGNYGINVTITDAKGNETTARPGAVLTVKQHTGAYLTLHYPEDISTTNKNPSTRTITVDKKPLNINVNDFTSVYGDELSTDMFSYEYQKSDFVYNETYKAAAFTNSLKEPEFVCLDREGNTVSKTSVAGDYTIRLQNGESDNYRFVYNNGTLTITKRPLTVTNILDGIPALTSDIIYRNQGETHRLAGKADKSRIEYENLVNNDDIGITYTAVYTSEQPDDAYDVGIEDIAMDNSVGRSSNYVVNTANSVSRIEGGGVIHDKEITKLEITQEPRLSYTYGGTLDLSDGRVTVTYDSGYVESDVPLNALTDTRIQIAYTDDKGEIVSLAKDGDKLTVPAHDGTKITLSARSVHKVQEVSTGALSIAKKTLEFGNIQVEPITYDGKTTQTTGVVMFKNPESGDNVTASGTFTFENTEAGNDKAVTVTDIVLNAPYGDNYVLPAATTTAYGTIRKASLTPQSVSAASVTVSEEDNSITITPPALTDAQIKGGAEYEYSIDGGTTWQKSNVFSNLTLGQDCKVCVRYADSANYAQSAASEPVTVRAYTVRVTLKVSNGGDILKIKYTNAVNIPTEEEFRSFIGETENTYYTLYQNEQGTEPIVFPFALSGDVTVYTTLTQPSKRGGSGGGGGGIASNPKSTAAPSPSATTVPSATDTPLPTDNPSATATPFSGGSKHNEPYLSGFEGLIRPDDYMTRAEAATLMVILSGETNEKYENIFPDVKEGTWYIDYIAEANARGLVAGFEDGNFYPETTVTREQFAAMVVRMADIEPAEGKSFLDIEENRWSAGSIKAAVMNGIISGYDDGTFRPENPIRRSEAVRMINAATGRIPDKELIDTIPCPYTDLPKTHWAYYEFMIASVKF